MTAIILAITTWADHFPNPERNSACADCGEAADLPDAKLVSLREGFSFPRGPGSKADLPLGGMGSMIAGSLANTEKHLRKVLFSAAAAAIVMLATLSEASALIRISYADKKIRIIYTNSTAPVPKRPGLNAASAAVLISDDRGGKIGDYLNAYASVRESGRRVIINGPCYSACTLVLGVVPRERICARSSAQLGFHAAAKKDLFGRQVSSPEGTQLVWDTYPADVRGWLTHRGGLSAQLIFLKGRELESMVRPCDSPVSRARNRSDIGEM